MKEFALVTLLLVAVIKFCDADRYIVKSEHELAGTCKHTCPTIGSITQAHGCAEIIDCIYSSSGWLVSDHIGYRCNFCRCTCVQPNTEPVQSTGPDDNYHKTNLHVLEHELYGTCERSGCHAGVDPIRTDFKLNKAFCSIVRNCRDEPHGGEYDGFNYCDKCKCDCLNPKIFTKYRLENLEFLENKDIGLAEFTKYTSGYGINAGDSTVKVEVKEEIKKITSTTWTNIDMKTIGSTVEISGNIPLFAETTWSLNYEESKTREFGTAETTEAQTSISAQMDIKGKSKKKKVPTATLR